MVRTQDFFTPLLHDTFYTARAQDLLNGSGHLERFMFDEWPLTTPHKKKKKKKKEERGDVVLSNKSIEQWA